MASDNARSASGAVERAEGGGAG